MTYHEFFLFGKIWLGELRILVIEFQEFCAGIGQVSLRMLYKQEKCVNLWMKALKYMEAKYIHQLITTFCTYYIHPILFGCKDSTPTHWEVGLGCLCIPRSVNYRDHFSRVKGHKEGLLVTRPSKKKLLFAQWQSGEGWILQILEKSLIEKSIENKLTSSSP